MGSKSKTVLLKEAEKIIKGSNTSNPEKLTSGKSSQKRIREAAFEGHYYMWENGQKTHTRFIQLAIQRQDQPLPEGFYKAAEKSNVPGIKDMLKAVRKRNLPATASVFDTRS